MAGGHPTLPRGRDTRLATNPVATPWEGISVTKTHLRAWSALMALVSVVLMLGSSVASAAPTARAADPTASARVTVTVTPTILVSKNANGSWSRWGPCTPSAKPAATTGASSGGFLVWIVVGLALVLAAGAAYWWLLLRRSATHAGRHPQEQKEALTERASRRPLGTLPSLLLVLFLAMSGVLLGASGMFIYLSQEPTLFPRAHMVRSLAPGRGFQRRRRPRLRLPLERSSCRNSAPAR